MVTESPRVERSRGRLRSREKFPRCAVETGPGLPHGELLGAPGGELGEGHLLVVLLLNKRVIRRMREGTLRRKWTNMKSRFREIEKGSWINRSFRRQETSLQKRRATLTATPAWTCPACRSASGSPSGRLAAAPSTLPFPPSPYIPHLPSRCTLPSAQT